MQLAYEFDDNGQITQIDKNGTLSSFNYLNGHLTGAVTPQGNYSYRYDTLGNRTHETSIETDGEREQKDYTYPIPGNGNRLLAKNQSTYNYNASGAPEQTDRYRYDYNTDQRPIKVYEGDTLLATYEYNSFGERIKKVVYAKSGNQVIYFLYEGHQLVAEIDATEDTPTHDNYRQTIYLGHAPVAYLHGKETYTVQSDHLGTPHRVTNSNEETVWAADYTPFGEATVLVERISFRHRFPGQYFDAETGIHHNYLRDYDPSLGRFLTSDPLGMMDGFNKYNYVHGNPIAAYDNFGLSATSFAIAVGTNLGRFALIAGGSVTPLGWVVIGSTTLAFLYTQYSDDFTNDAVEKPSTHDFQVLLDEFNSYNPGIIENQESLHEGGWESYFELLNRLQNERQVYADRYEDLLTNPGQICPLPIYVNEDLFSQAILGIANHEAGLTQSNGLEFSNVEFEEINSDLTYIHGILEPDLDLGIVLNQSDRTPEEEAQAQAEYEIMKDLSELSATPPPPPNDKDAYCKWLHAQIHLSNAVITRYRAWDAKWLNGRHAEKIANRENTLNNLCLLYTSPSPRDRG